MLIEMTIYWTK